MLRHFLIVLCVVVCTICTLRPSTLIAQGAPSKNTIEQLNSWSVFLNTFRLNNEWSVSTDIQIRRSRFVDTWMQSLNRIGLNYHVNPDLTLTVGYAYVLTYPYGKQPIPSSEYRQEHRFWEQVNLTSRFSSLELQHRFRLEQRLLNEWSIPDVTTGSRSMIDGFILENRFRYRFMANIPLARNAQSQQTWFASLHNEIFINVGGNIGFNVFDQNRAVAMLGYQFSPLVNLQIGYMNQSIQKPNGRDMESNHTLTTYFTYNFDFR